MFAGCHSATNSGNTTARLFSPGRIFRFEQYGQPVPCIAVRLLTVACQTCLLFFAHSHHAIRPERGVTSAAEKSFNNGCHSAATSGLTAARLFWLRNVLLPEQNGQPTPILARFLTRASQTCCELAEHTQWYSAFEPALTSLGDLALSVGCHWLASSGCVVARSLRPGTMRRFAQIGQPTPPERLPIAACHSWRGSTGQSHQALSFEPGDTSDGDRVFFDGCH